MFAFIVPMALCAWHVSTCGVGACVTHAAGSERGARKQKAMRVEEPRDVFVL